MDARLGAEIDWLYGLQHFGIKLGLDNIRRLLDETGHPERRFRSVLVAGTNGKGSVAAMLHSMLSASGVDAGLFTSPHLVRPNERIRIGRDDIADEALRERLAGLRRRIEDGVARGVLETHPSFFEVVTAAALESFAEARVRLAVLEVGLGGRLDATNAVDADLSVIVSIDLDHTKTLGETIEQIAAEKGGILKPGRPLVSGVVRQRAIRVLQDLCRERGVGWVDACTDVRLVAERAGTITLESSRHRYDDLRLALGGRHQIHNARVAVAALERVAEIEGFEVDPLAVRRGLAEVRWPGRLQWVRDPATGVDLLLDGAHNPAGVQTLVSYLATLGRPAPIGVIAVMRGKLVDEMLALVVPRLARVVVTRAAVDRAEDPEEVARVARRFWTGGADGIEVVPEATAALARARQLAAGERDVLVSGSLYLVGEILASLAPRPEPGPVSM